VLIPRIHERYGSERSALVAAFPTYRARGAIREIGKALGLAPGEIERVARGSEGWSSRDVDRDIDAVLGEGRRTGRWAWLARLADEAFGLPRHLSQHSGGMIVATRPLVDCVPLVPAAMEGRQLAQWDKDSCSDAGFLKIDLLGLGMLSAVERCVEHVAARRGERIDLSRIPFDDPATYECIQNAETTGVFQIESRAQMGSLRRTRPKNLDEITIQVAIVRPGPIVGGAVNPYIERRQRLNVDPDFQVPYLHPSLEPPLRDTLGTIIFQDQVLEVAQAFAGFSVGEAEGLRRAMSRKRSAEAIEAHHRRFVQGAMDKHPDVGEELAERVFQMVSGFSGFGFPKAHGAAFGLLAYQSTWLRVHYGPEFLCSLMDEQPMGFYPPDALVHEAQRRGIEVLAPDVNASEAGCTVTADGAVRVGLGYVLGVRADEIAALVAARCEGGPFRSLEDLASRAGAGRAALERLAWSGACDGLAGGDRRVALWQLGVAAPGVRRFRAVGRRQGRVSDARGVGSFVQLALALDLPAPPPLKALPAWEAMVADYASTGLTATTHPIRLLRPRLRGEGADGIGGLARLRHGAPVRVGGLVVARQRPGTAKGILFLLLEDEYGTVNVVVSPQVYERHRLEVRTEPLLIVEGRLERHASAGGAINIVARRVLRLEVPDRLAAEVKDISQLDLAELARQSEMRVVATGTHDLRATGTDDFRATGTDDFRAVAPAVQSFAAGRRR
jgi:error-prone DNA polymerase